jgi:hypothetical protein
LVRLNQKSRERESRSSGVVNLKRSRGGSAELSRPGRVGEGFGIVADEPATAHLATLLCGLFVAGGDFTG